MVDNFINRYRDMEKYIGELVSQGFTYMETEGTYSFFRSGDWGIETIVVNETTGKISVNIESFDLKVAMVLYDITNYIK